jgi:hypothetical protein
LLLPESRAGRSCSILEMVLIIRLNTAIRLIALQ